MASQDLVLCIDIGDDSIKAAEFSFPSDGSVVLERFAFNEYACDAEEDVSAAMMAGLKDIVGSNGFLAKTVHISMSGRNAFVRFVRIPAMTDDAAKIKELISFEAKQTIPFPMDEVVWDSQLLPPAPDDDTPEKDAMLAILKNDTVTGICDLMDKLGKEVTLIEVAPTACYNSARANLIGEHQCEMILNIGGKTSTLVFVDGGRFFMRIISIAGNSITQQIAKEFNIPFADAEEMKRRHGFVALGGAYEEPESEVAATVSKIVRNVMTRLFGEINRSINVYRASQHGRKPEKLYLTGGSSVMAFTPRFFSEKLNIPVEYFNPFKVITLSDGLDQEVLKEVAHVYGETIGLALRHIGTSPIEINLTPAAVRKQHAFKLKRPYFYAIAAVFILFFALQYWTWSIQAENIQRKCETYEKFVDAKKRVNERVTKAEKAYRVEKDKYDAIVSLLDTRNNLVEFFNDFQKMVPKNMWFTKIAFSSEVAANPDGDQAKKQTSSTSSFRRSRFGAKPAESPSSSKSSAEDAIPTGDLKWLNLEGYINCGNDNISDANEALGLFASNLTKKSKLFNEREQDIRSEQDQSSTDVNISSFKLSIELKKPVNRKEFDQFIRENRAAELLIKQEAAK